MPIGRNGARMTWHAAQVGGLGLAALVLLVYGAALGYLFLRQRAFIYFPDTQTVAPGAAGLPAAEAIAIATADGERLVGWLVAPREGQPLILYLHGNAGNLAVRAARFADLTAHGAGLLAIDYRGFGGSTGHPSEKGLLLDADAAYGEALARGYAPARIVVFGESLGTGVAVALAARVPVAGLVLEAAYTSTLAIAESVYWMFPIGYLMIDTFRSDLKIAQVKAPILFLHGTADGVVAIRYGAGLFALAPEPKSFVTIDGGGHQVLESPGVLAQVRDWIEARCEPAICRERHG
jgi:fermentation-respiration switch protein FrsA (DUF1100 family)